MSTNRLETSAPPEPKTIFDERLEKKIKVVSSFTIPINTFPETVTYLKEKIVKQNKGTKR